MPRERRNYICVSAKITEYLYQDIIETRIRPETITKFIETALINEVNKRKEISYAL